MKTPRGIHSPRGALLTKVQAEQALLAMMSDKKSDYHASTTARRQAAVLRAKILGRIAYAE